MLKTVCSNVALLRQPPCDQSASLCEQGTDPLGCGWNWGLSCRRNRPCFSHMQTSTQWPVMEGESAISPSPQKVREPPVMGPIHFIGTDLGHPGKGCEPNRADTCIQRFLTRSLQMEFLLRFVGARGNSALVGLSWLLPQGSLLLFSTFFLAFQLPWQPHSGRVTKAHGSLWWSWGRKAFSLIPCHIR